MLGTGHRRRAARGQATYYVATGAWPLVSPGSFQAVTGRKHDVWLVQTVGALIGVVGMTLATADRERLHETTSMRALAMGSALALATVDVVFVARRRISPIYLLDAVLELAIVAAWLRPSPRVAGSSRRAQVAGPP